MNTLQQRIVMFLVNVESAKGSQIIDALATHTTTFKVAIPELLESDYIEVEKDKYGRNIYSLTTDGRLVGKRLIRYASTEGEIVKAPSINKMVGTYVPSIGYQRNDGRNLQVGGI